MLPDLLQVRGLLLRLLVQELVQVQLGVTLVTTRTRVGVREAPLGAR